MNTTPSAAPPTRTAASASSLSARAKTAREKAKAELRRGSGGTAVEDERTLAKGTKLHK